jgi:hypothetical protein
MSARFYTLPSSPKICGYRKGKIFAVIIFAVIIFAVRKRTCSYHEASGTSPDFGAGKTEVFFGKFKNTQKGHFPTAKIFTANIFPLRYPQKFSALRYLNTQINTRFYTLFKRQISTRFYTLFKRQISTRFYTLFKTK